MVSFCDGKATQIFWFVLQLQLPQYLFGITYLHSEWRLIWFGNQSGISWRRCISFSATRHSSIPSGLFSIVSLTFSLSSCPDFLLGQTGGNLTRTACRNIFYASSGLWNWSVVHWHEMAENSLFFGIQYWLFSDLLHPRVGLSFSLSRIILIGIHQWSSQWGHGLCGIGTSVCPLFFQYSTSLFGVRPSSSWVNFSAPWDVSSRIPILDLWLTFFYG